MGNGNEEIIHPAWQTPILFDVYIPFILNGEPAVIERLHANMRDVDEGIHIEVRIDFPNRPRYENWKQGMKPPGDVFYLPCQHHSKKELISAIQEQEQERLTRYNKNRIAEANLDTKRVKKRAEIDNIVAKIVETLPLEIGASSRK